MIKLSHFAFWISLLVISEVLAHEGPPYPILVDKKFSNYKISVWTDPDTDKGTFLFYPEGENLKSDDFIYQIKATPQSGAPEILSALAMKGEQQNGYFTYTATIPFPKAMLWNVRILIKNKQNNEVLLDQTLSVEVTTPGPNRTETLVYLMPFLLVGAIWIKVVMKKRKKTARPM
ncbi:MAG: hypothetical protein H7336_16180 [Bacteriovorax sp.]|nr:hypothetical protein [Bacteriovorax sp.]